MRHLVADIDGGAHRFHGARPLARIASWARLLADSPRAQAVSLEVWGCDPSGSITQPIVETATEKTPPGLDIGVA